MIRGVLKFGEFREDPTFKSPEFTNPNNKQQTYFYQIHKNGSNGFMLTMFVYEPRNPAFGVREVHTERMVRKGIDGFGELKEQAQRKRDDATNPPHLGLL